MVAKIRLGVYLATCLICIVVPAIAENSYLFIAPKTIRPGQDLIIQASLLVDPLTPVDVTATLEKMKHKDQSPPWGWGPIRETTTTQSPGPPEPLSTAYVQLTDKVVKTFNLNVPYTLPEGEYGLRIVGMGGLEFENTTELTYKSKSHSIFIQTDKAIYKPGQTVHYRVFGVTPDLKVKFDRLDVDIYDPIGNKISQFDVTDKEMLEAGGIFESEMPMSDSPLLGDWKIKATLGKERTEKEFTVDEYVLPKFETKVILPSFVRTSDKNVEVEVTAKYTYGKPVNGIANLRVRAEHPIFKWVNGTSIRVNGEVELQKKIEGSAIFTIPMEQLDDILGGRLNFRFLVFQANATETLTGAKLESEEARVQFFDNPIKLEFPSSLPNNFKPGLSYTAVVKVSEQDGTPPTMTDGQMSVNVTFVRPLITTTTTSTTTTTTPPPPVIANGSTILPLLPEIRIEPRIRPGGFWWGPREDRELQPEKFYSVPSDGLVEIPLDIPAEVTKVEISVNYKGSSEYKSIQKSNSPSNSYIQLRLLTDSPKTGDTIGLQIRTTDINQQTAVYQVVSKGTIVASGEADLASGILNFPITADMAPKARVMVYYVKPDGEIVTDGMSFNVEGIFENQVNIDFDKPVVQPADKIKLTVTADPGSKVNVLAVDKSVLLLKSGNDVTKDDVKTELQSYDSTDGFWPCDWFCWRWPMATGGDDTYDVFKNAGLVYITDALVYNHVEPVWTPRVMGMMLDVQDDVMFDSPEMVLESAAATNEASSSLKPVEKVRKLFPETWMWQSQQALLNGSVVFEDNVPDTITSWIATAFAIHPETGLGVTESSASLKTFMPFFVSLHMPYSVVQGEKVIVQANIFNYADRQLFAYVLLKKNSDFQNVHISSGWSSEYSADVARFVRIKPNNAAAVYFPIIPKKIGKIRLQIYAQSLIAADAIEKEILVEPSGTPQEYNVPVMIDLKQTPNFQHTVPVSFPPATVKGSERVRVSVIGDLMGPSISGLDSLLKMPYGCGEQNMLNFAPNIFITQYLETTNNLDQAILSKAKNFMIKGYQRELTYQHKDGSFSAFGNSDPSGSMWLSAFVVKSFVQAKPFIFVDDKIIVKTVQWILQYQNANGTFREPGRVLHREMQGGSIAGERSLTAFVLAALLEARSIEGVNAEITTPVQLAIKYLEDELLLMTDVYELAITSYVLALGGSSQTQAALDKLQALATMEGGMKYWKKADAPVKKDLRPWAKNKGKALNVELSAYALLALAESDNREDGMLVLKWLTSQRNPEGGFASTQDTIVALQALAKLAAIVYSKDNNANVEISAPTFSGGPFYDNIVVTPENALVLQSRELPSNIGQVDIAASGTGFCLVEVAVFYHINRDDDTPSFNMKIALPEESMNDFIVQVCTSYMKEGAAGMSVIEVGYPSGFAADKEGISSHPLLKRKEDGDKKVILYLDEIGKEEICFNIPMQRNGMVASAQPVAVKVYDYYEPDDHVTEFYVPEVLRKSDVCDVCGKACDFCQRRRRRWWNV